MNKICFIFLLVLAICFQINADVVSKLNYYANMQSKETNNGWGRKMNGKLGHGFNILSGEVGLPIGEIAIDYNHKWHGFALPPVSQISSNVYGCFFTQYAWRDIGAVRQKKNLDLKLSNTAAYNQGIFGTDVTTIKNQYLNGDDVLTINMLSYEPLHLCTRSPKYLKLNRWADLAIKVLPNNYHSYLEKLAYRTFVKHWGTHYVSCAGMGGQIQSLDSIDYTYNSNTAATESKYRFQRETKLDAHCKPLSKLPAVDPNFINKSVPQYSAYGGNVAYAEKGDLNNFVKSIDANPTVIRVKHGSLRDLIHDGQKAKNVEFAINDLVRETTNAWNALSTCPLCHNGSCVNGKSVCTCYGHAYGRTCDQCGSGYSGTGCRSFGCSRCNTAGGTCIGPNQCRCNKCYGGAACDQYTCGCMAGEGLLVLPNNSTIPASEVQVGDIVQVVNAEGKKTFSDVFYVRERDIGQKVGLLKLTTKSRSVVITVDHLLYSASELNSVFTDNIPIMAEKVTVGSLIWVDVDGKMVVESVIDVSVSETRSMMSVQTLEGNVVIDGVAVSSYETNETWGWIESLEERLVYKMFPSVAKTELYKKMSNLFEDYIQIPIVDYFMEKFIWDAPKDY
eukprot:TRINITY_DN4516_c1_g2_i1.p1 TRINITY_DN4516_c1_g2~~TRINITY_DN4516_c1_g2_i1.p1  ORF type:complete len:618 (-),score=161.52 TRINITY_DN4516_c1_g2_i1:670-2523(-)